METTLDRREFLRNSLRTGAGGSAATILAGVLAGGGALLIPGLADANKGFDPRTSHLAGSVFYTRKRPGRWAGVADGHVPTFSRRGNALQVKTLHPMKGYKHYIIKHQLFDANFRLLGESVFDPEKDFPVSTYDITSLEKAVFATSMCNLHDIWLAGIKI